MPPFPYKTQPLYAAQREILMRSAGQFAHFLQMEQGTGKTWVTLNTAAYLYLRGEIDGVIVCAPNGVHTQWATDQIPSHLPDSVPRHTYVWRSAAETRDRHRRQRRAAKDGTTRIDNLSADFRAFVASRDSLAVLCLNTEAVGCVKALDTAVTHMLRERRCMLVLDESSDYATPSTRRTRSVMRWARHARFRRCLDGTPTNGLPWDMWTAYHFLHPKIIAYAPTYRAMKEAHGEWFEWDRGNGQRAVPLLRKTLDGKPILKNLDTLATATAPYTSRVTKSEVLPFLPPKSFTTTTFDLSPEQTDLMRTLRRELRIRFETRETVTADHVLTLQIRLQQIACGFVPTDIVWGTTEEATVQPVTRLALNPRLDALVAALAQRSAVSHPTIVWARYHLDIDLLAVTLRAAGYRVGVYDGRVTQVARDYVKDGFQAGMYDIFLGNPAAGAKGLNLYRATSVIYYTNYFGLRRRLQSEDRAHRIGTTEPVYYTDLVGMPHDLQPTTARAKRESVDWAVLKALRANKSVADLLTGDVPLKEWI